MDPLMAVMLLQAIENEREQEFRRRRPAKAMPLLLPGWRTRI